MRKSNYSQEFRESTIKFCIDNSDRSISSIERDLGLNKGKLTLWVNNYKIKNNMRWNQYLIIIKHKNMVQNFFQQLFS